MFVVAMMAGFLAAAAASPTSAITTTATLPFRADYPYNHAARKFYKHHNSPASWERAREICHQEGAELAVPETPQQKEALTGMRTHIWLGVYAPVRTVYEETAVHLNYSLGYGILMETDGSTHCEPFTKEYQFVCEISEETACNASVPGYTLGPDARSCYKLHTIWKNWTDALMTCVGEDAQLTIINSQQEADHIATLIVAVEPEPPNWTLIGFYEMFKKDIFFTLDGLPLGHSGYVKWAPGEPNNHNGVEESCGSINPSGQLNDYSCAIAAPFICEKKSSAPIAASPDCRGDVSISEVQTSK